MNPEPLETLTDLMCHLGIQVLLFDETYEQIEQIDYGFRKKMLKDFDYQMIADSMRQHLQAGVYYSFQDDLTLQYFFFRFPKEAESVAGGQVLCLGPVFFHPMSQGNAFVIFEKYDIPSRYHQDFLEFFNRIPLFHPYEYWHQIIVFFLSRCGFSLKFSQIDIRTVKQFPSMDYHFFNPETSDVAFHSIAERYTWENKMINAVSAGNTQEALDAHYHFRQFRLIPRVPDPVRNQKNLMFTLNTLLRKAVEKAHIHPFHIDNLSRQFAIEIESSCTMEFLDSLPSTMIRKYCMLVNNYSRLSNSALIRTCLDYIDFHYNSELSLASLAAMNYVSPPYLSTQFKKETGITVTDYINQTRIRQSLLLLNASHYSIGEIAAQCGFSDANYFTRTFKKLLGKTPTAYRNEIQA